jgi:PilZ domain
VAAVRTIHAIVLGERVWSARREMKESKSISERRGSKRFRLRLAVVFSWRDTQGVVQSSEGSSCNISSRGIYVRTNLAPPVGTAVEMNVFLPQPAFDIRAAEIHAKGYVTRVDPGPLAQTYGFAAMNRTVLIRESLEHALERNNGAEQGSRVA